MEKCRNCNEIITTNYCGNCGRPKEPRRIDSKYLLQEVGSVLFLEKGIFFTIKELLLRPGKSIREFLTEDRFRLIKPIIFIIVTSLIYTLSNQVFHFEEAYIKYEGIPQSSTTKIFEWIGANYGYANIIMAIFIAFWLKLFFRKFSYNYFETLILLFFLMGMGMLILALFGMIESFLKRPIIQYASIGLFIYIIWGIGQFYKGKFSSYVKAFAAYVLGFLFFSFAAVLIGMLMSRI